MPPPPRTDTLSAALRAGFAVRCPRCGRGRVFRGFLTLRSGCEVCGLNLEAHDVGDGAVSIIILIVGFFAVGGLLIMEVAYEPPAWVHLVIWLPFALAGVLALMRPVEATMIGLQYKYRRDEFDQPR